MAVSKGKRGSRAGKEAEDFVKMFLMGRKAGIDNQLTEARLEYYKGLAAKANKPGMTPAALQAHVNGGSTASGGNLSTEGGENSPAAVRAYVRQAAEARGIDPDIAERVVRQESGFNINARGGKDERGVMQLLPKGGLGEEFAKRGISLEPSNWKQQVDASFDVVKKDGWRQWYGARDVGIGRWQGINRDQKTEAAYKPGAVERKPLDPPKASTEAPASKPSGPTPSPARAPAPPREAIPADPSSDLPRMADPKDSGFAPNSFQPDKGEWSVRPEQTSDASAMTPDRTMTAEAPAQTTEMAYGEAIPTESESFDVADSGFEADMGIEPGVDMALFAEEGGMIDEPAPLADVPFDEALGAALRGVQNMYGLRENAALPGTDPDYEGGVRSMARNELAASQEDYAQVMQSIDPERQMSPSQAHAIALQKMYSFHRDRGDTEAGEIAAGELLQTMRQRSMQLGAIAGAALEAGDVERAGKALIAAYNQIPDGREVDGQIDPSGRGVVVIKDTATGEEVQRMPVTPQLLQQAVQRLASGADFYPQLARKAAPAPRAEPRGALEFEEGGLVDPEDREAAQDAARLEDDGLGEYADEGDRPAEYAQEVQGAGMAPIPMPAAPKTIPYHPDMNDAQRKYVDGLNRERLNEYRTQRQLYQQQRGAQYIQDRADRRDESRQKAAAELEASRQRAAELSAQRQRNNGRTDAELDRAVEPSRQMAASALNLEADVAAQPKEYRQMQAAPAMRAPSRGVALPEGLDTPRDARERLGNVSRSFDREFAMAPQDQALARGARRIRESAIDEFGLTAADVRAQASQRSRGEDLESRVNSALEDDNAFIRAPKAGESPSKGRTDGMVNYADKVSPGEREQLKLWTSKVAQANKDLPVSTAFRATQALLKFDPNDPSSLPNYRVRLDKDGRGRVELRDGSLSFNVDRETLQQIGMMRNAAIRRAQAQNAEASGRAQESALLDQTRDERVRKVAADIKNWKDDAGKRAGGWIKSKLGIPERSKEAAPSSGPPSPPPEVGASDAARESYIERRKRQARERAGQ